MADRASTADTRVQSSIRALRRSKYTGWAVTLGPGVFWLTVFFLVPLLIMVYYSLGERGAFGEILLGPANLGLQQYAYFLVPSGATIPEAIWYTVAWSLEGLVPFPVELAGTDPTVFVQVTIKSVAFGLATTLVSLVIGYPSAYAIVRFVPKGYQKLGIMLVILPYWASYLVRIYAVKMLLFKNGPIVSFLNGLPFVSGINLLYSDAAVMLGMVYIYVPFIILPVYASIDDVDFSMREAAMDLGARPFTAFWRVVLPLTKPGIFAGSILVFIPATGTFVIPELLGGGGQALIGKFIADQFGSAGNWPLGAAGAFILTAIILAIIGVYQRYLSSGDLA